jgi:hypothetical protein
MRYRVSITTELNVVVHVDAADEDDAAETAWQIAEQFAQTIGTRTGDDRIKAVEASFDGIGADEVELHD